MPGEFDETLTDGPAVLRKYLAGVRRFALSLLELCFGSSLGHRAWIVC